MPIGQIRNPCDVYITKLQLCFSARQSLSSHLQKKTLHRSLCLICILQKNTSQHLLFGLVFKKKAILLHSFSFSLIVFSLYKNGKNASGLFLAGENSSTGGNKKAQLEADRILSDSQYKYHSFHHFICANIIIDYLLVHPKALLTTKLKELVLSINCEMECITCTSIYRRG